VWKCRPEVQCEYLGRQIVVFEIGFADEGGEMGMWYATASAPWRKTTWVLLGGGERGVGFGVGRLVRAIVNFSKDEGGRGCWRMDEEGYYMPSRHTILSDMGSSHDEVGSHFWLQRLCSSQSWQHLSWELLIWPRNCSAYAVCWISSKVY
jgi:hypothetical protein